MRIYNKDSKKSLPFINYNRIEPKTNLITFLYYFICPKSLIYSRFFKSSLDFFQNNNNQIKCIYSDTTVDFIKECICERGSFIKHKNKVLAAWATSSILVYDAEAIQNYLYTRGNVVVFQDKIIEFVEKDIQSRNNVESPEYAVKGINMSSISESNPELQFIVSVNGI